MSSTIWMCLLSRPSIYMIIIFHYEFRNNKHVWNALINFEVSEWVRERKRWSKTKLAWQDDCRWKIVYHTCTISWQFNLFPFKVFSLYISYSLLIKQKKKAWAHLWPFASPVFISSLMKKKKCHYLEGYCSTILDICEEICEHEREISWLKQINFERRWIVFVLYKISIFIDVWLLIFHPLHVSSPIDHEQRTWYA